MAKASENAVYNLLLDIYGIDVMLWSKSVCGVHCIILPVELADGVCQSLNVNK